MTHKSHLGILVASVSAVALCVGLAVANNSANPIDFAKADPTTYTINVNSTVFGASTLTTDYQTTVTQNFGEDKPVLNYFLAKKDGSDNLVLAPAGKLYNYASGATYKGRITNIERMTITYSGGNLYIQEGIGGGATQYDTKAAITSGVEYTFKTSPNHFMISNSRAATTITSMSITYSCSEAGYTVSRLGEKYNGKSAEGDTYVLTRDGNNVSVAGQTGTIALDGSGNFTINLASGTIVYTGKVSADYKTLTFLEKSGANAALAPTIGEMNRIYVMADFENYTDRGTGYTADTASMFTVSDLRGDYYVDAGSGSGATWVSGSSFKIPSTANYLNLCTGLKHGGNKAMLLQGQKAGWVRLWNSEVFNQNQHYNFGTGNRLSFFVHSARNNNDGTGVNASDVTIRAQVYYQNFSLTDSNRNSTTYGTGTKDFVIATDSGWNECVINLDPAKKVYAMNIMINNSGLKTDYVFMPIDDITIYTEPVFEPTKKYEETATQFTKSYHGSVALKKDALSTSATMKIGIGANGFVFGYAGANMGATSYTVVGNTITIETTGTIDLSDLSGGLITGEYTFGTWVGTLSNSNTQITFTKANISGDVTEIINTNSFTLTEDNKLADGSEGTAGLQAIFDKQKRPSDSWVDSDDGDDKITQNSDFYIQGSNSIRLKPMTTNMRIIVKPSILSSRAQDIDTVAFWIYAPAGVSYTMNFYCYNGYNPVGSGYSMPGSYTSDGSAEKAGWHYFNCGLSKNYKKSFAIFISSTSSQTILDYITYF